MRQNYVGSVTLNYGQELSRILSKLRMYDYIKATLCNAEMANMKNIYLMDKITFPDADDIILWYTEIMNDIMSAQENKNRSEWKNSSSNVFDYYESRIFNK